MTDAVERAAADDLSQRVGLRLLDDSDWMFDNEGNRIAARSLYWCVVNGHDDERLDQPIRYGQWPATAEMVVQQLWHRSVALAAEKAKNAKYRSKLSFVACGMMVGSLTFPLLLRAFRVINCYQFGLLWHYGTYLAVAALGALCALVAGWWTQS